MTTTADRERTRHQLQGLAELARHVSPDSSGYVDLSTFASDPNGSMAWVDNALRTSEPPKIDRLDAESMRPVALESLIDHEEVVGPKTARMQKAFIIASSVCIAGLAVAAIALALRSPDAPVRAAHAVAAVPAAVVPAVVADTKPAPPVAEPVAAALVQAAPAAVIDTVAPVAPQGTPGSSRHTRKLVAPSSGVRVHAARGAGAGAASTSALSSRSSGKSGKKGSAAANDSLMGAIQQSMATPSSNK